VGRYLIQGWKQKARVPVRQLTRHAIYLGTVERRAGTSGISGAEGILRESAQDSTRVFEELKGLTTSAGDHRGDLQGESDNMGAWMEEENMR